MFDVDPLPYAERRIATGLVGDDGERGGVVHALHIDPESALLEYLSMYYKLGRAGRALDRFGVIEFATTIAPGVRDVLLTGKVYEATKRNAPQQGRHRVRRRGARRAPDRPDHPVPRRHQRAGGAGEGRPDQDPVGQRDAAAALRPHRRAPGHRARGDAGPGDGRRHRRPARARPARRRRGGQPGPPPGARRRALAAVRKGKVDRVGGGRRPEARRPRGRRRAGGRAARRGRATTPSDGPSRTSSARWSPAWTCRRTSCRASPTASTSAPSTSSPRCCASRAWP